MEGYLRVGMILRPHGVRGAVKLLPLTEDLSRFRRLKSCFLERDGAYVPIEVQAASPQQDGVILQLSCAHTREEAEGLRNLYVCVGPGPCGEAAAGPVFRGGHDRLPGGG